MAKTVKNYKKDFPIFRQAAVKLPLIYFDSAATSQKPEAVIRAEDEWYRRFNANTHRGVYQLSEIATQLFEDVRQDVARFINAPDSENIVFTKGTTEGINLVAGAWGRVNLKSGDTILLTELDHHANLIPWQVLAQENDLKLRFIPIDKRGRLDLKPLNLLLAGVKLVGFNHISNALGTINPARKIIRAAHRRGAAVILDAAQSVPHMPVDVKKLDPDFFVFSSHKMLGPSGAGVLYIKKSRYAEMSTYQTGGAMFEEVHWKKSTYRPGPWKFEAGTQPFAQIYGLSAAIKYLKKIGLDKIQRHERRLAQHAYEKLSKIPEVVIYGPPVKERAGVITFTVKGIHGHDVASLLDNYGIAVRAGHHCTQPLHRKLGVPATVRLSFYIYNTLNEVDYFIKSLKEIIKTWP